MQFLKDIYHLFYPKLCVCCSQELVSSENIICVSCLHDLPLLNIKNTEHNPIRQLFVEVDRLAHVIAFLSYSNEGKTQQLIHHLKYKGQQEIGTWLGDWFGRYLNRHQLLEDIDFIVPVPLHPKKERARGYNQLYTFGAALARHLEKPMLKNVLLRQTYSSTQTHKSRWERFQQKKSVFTIPDLSVCSHKHILLIDDVITTGATLLSCCEAMALAEGVKISIASLAFTE